MAQKTIVHLVDDLDGGDADETVSFGLDGNSYEIDLSKANAGKIREALAPFVGAARKATSGGRPAGRRGAGPSRRQSSDRTNDIRRWAREQGYQVSDRGRIARNIEEAYNAAH